MNRRLIQIGLGFGCAIFFLWLALSRVDSHAVGVALAAASPTWIAAAVVVYAVNLAVRAWRWSIILQQVERVRFGAVAMALVVGYGVNFILPARLGELFRAEFCKQRYNLSRVWALTSIVIERLLDGLIIVGCLGAGLFLSGFGVKQAPVFIGVLVTATTIFGAVLLVAVAFSGSTAPKILARWPSIAGQMDMARRGLEIVRSRRFAAAIGVTVVVYVMDTATIWLIVRAVGLSLDLPSALILVGIASLSTLLPSGPGFVGTLQLSYALAMELFGFQPALGVATATIAQLCLYLPLAVVAGLSLAFGSATMARALYSPRRGQ